MQINADRTQPALVRGSELPWVQSPEPGIERRMLERIGEEVALATSIVRYRAGSRFSSHAHALGEEFYVLEGIFSDERGDYPVGTYVRNPPSSAHSPRSESGCTILVKLRQMHPDDRNEVRSFGSERTWRTQGPRHQTAMLYHTTKFNVALERLAPGATVGARTGAGGEEIFVVEGAIKLVEDGTQLGAWDWLRRPGDRHQGFTSELGALLWIKRGHLPCESLT